MSAATGYPAAMLPLLLLLACADGSVDVTVSGGDGGDGGADGGADGGSADDSGGPPPDPPPCPVDALHEQPAHLQDPEITETSGLVASALDPGVLWLHNDSGDEARLFAVDLDGQTVGTVTLEGAGSGDWEDLALGPGPDGAPWLYVGDIGDNARSDGTVRIWMLPEPAAQDATLPATPLALEYPDGPHDAEAMLVDSQTATLLLLTKETDGISRVYAVDLQAETPALEKVAEVDLNDAATGMLPLVTAADVTPDGRCVLVRTYTHLLGFERPEGQPIHAAFDSPPVLLQTEIELQGETVAAFPGGYWTIAEGQGTAMNRFTLPPPP